MARQERRSLPVGVFDSGLGGLSVLSVLRKIFPHEDFIYVGDNANSPVGNRPKEEIIEISKAIATYLGEVPVKLAVIACNTFTVVTQDALEEALDYPFVGMSQGVNDALDATTSGRIGIMATVATINSHRHRQVMKAVDPGIHVVEQPCPELAGYIESGHLHDEALIDLVRGYVNPLLREGVDTAVMACTHYPLVETELSRASEGRIEFIDPAYETARLVEQVLDGQDLRNPQLTEGTVDICFTKSADVVQSVVDEVFSHDDCPVRIIQLREE